MTSIDIQRFEVACADGQLERSVDFTSRSEELEEI